MSPPQWGAVSCPQNGQVEASLKKVTVVGRHGEAVRPPQETFPTVCLLE